MKTFRILGLTAAAALISHTSSAQQAAGTNAPVPSTAESGILGRIGDIEITIEELRTVLGNLGVKDGAVANNDPAVLNQVVRSLLVQRVLLQEAQDKGWDQQPIVKAQLERVRESTITESYLQSIANPPETFPSEAELKTAYEANKAALLVPRSYRLAQVFIAVPKDVENGAVDKANAQLAEVKQALAAKDADFADVASKYSQETESAGRGGEIGWLLETQIQPEIREKLPRLALNIVSDPIRLADGWHIVKVMDVREPFTPTLDQVRPQLTQRMRTEKTKANSEAYLAKLLKEHPVAINELALSQVFPKQAN